MKISDHYETTAIVKDSSALTAPFRIFRAKNPLSHILLLLLFLIL